MFLEGRDEEERPINLSSVVVVRPQRSISLVILHLLLENPREGWKILLGSGLGIARNGAGGSSSVGGPGAEGAAADPEEEASPAAALSFLVWT